MIQFICFSKDRPLQLHGYLQSFYRYVNSGMLAGDKHITVIAKASTSDYQKAYDELITEFPGVKFVWETNFHDDLMKSIDDRPYICFGCDDVVFFNTVNVNEVLSEFDDDKTFAFSFRLGMNVHKSMFCGDMKYPKFMRNDGVLSWDLHSSHHCGDWGYSWELNGTVYPTNLAKQVIEEVKANSPNILENSGGGKWSKMTVRHLMKCWIQSKLVVPTVNVVQTNFGNPICGDKPLSPEFLLQCWNNGLRLDIEPYHNTVHDSVHVPSFFLRRV